MKRILSVCILSLLAMSGLTCSKKNAVSEAEIKKLLAGVVAKEPKISVSDLYSIITLLSQKEISIPSRNVKKPSYSISDKYNKDPLDFKSLAVPSLKYDKYAVVGKDRIKLYKDIGGKAAVAELPKGAIIPLIEEIKNKKNDVEGCPGFFKFNEETNYWYKTEYKGSAGFVFGAYIINGADYAGFDGGAYSGMVFVSDEMTIKYNDTEYQKLQKLSYYLTKGVASDSFYDFNGRCNLSETVQTDLKKNRIALEKVRFDEYKKYLNGSGYGAYPDDMIALYAMLHNDKTAATFISIDFFTHSLHLLFDRMMQDTEVYVLFPVIKALTISYYNALTALEKDNGATSKAYGDAVTVMKKYFMVAGDLLGLTLADRSSYPSDVTAELGKIRSAGGMDVSAIFNYKEDYSQFKPRGHYTKNESLKKYFKAMMWFGRLHFYCVKNHPDPNIVRNSIRLTRAALVLTKIAKENKEILAMWRAVANPIDYIVGQSDDYTLEQYLSISDDVDFKNLGAWMERDNNIASFIGKANSSLQGPRISGNTLMQNPEFTRNSPATPAGFRFLGQRFTLDNFIHQLLSMPRIQKRTMVKGLDVMGVLGSAPADRLLKAEKESYPGYEKNYNSLRTAVNGFAETQWRNTYYNNYLRVIREVLGFDSTAPFYFTKKEAWNKKSLLTAHGVWAELRHDTLLYAKQSAAEMAGPGPCMTYDIDKLKRPVGYIEPNLGALYWLQSLVKDCIAVLSDNKFMLESYAAKFKEFETIIDRAVAIAEREAADKDISDEQNEFIYSIPSSLGSIVMPDEGNIISPDELKMALIADVHTDMVNNTALEVATGIPNRIYVALNDGNGGRRIATGYMYSYYEFEQPMGNRLNDEEWKKQVYGERPSVEKYIPEWAADILKKND